MTGALKHWGGLLRFEEGERSPQLEFEPIAIQKMDGPILNLPCATNS